jgi:glycosyltransferase involved in cell wall biosynthesis
MKVGVLLDTRSLPTIGGGYTFEQQIFQALLAKVDSSPHEFVVITMSRKIPAVLAQYPNIRVIALAREQANPWLIFRAWIELVLRYLKRRTLKRTRSFSTQLKYVINQKILEAHGIEFVWALTPLKITPDTPYAITIWDLEYCTQPYFPELSFGDEWDQREYFAIPIRRAAYIFTGTEVGKQQIEKLYQKFSDRIRVLPLPTPQFALDHGAGSHQVNDTASQIIDRRATVQAKLDKYGLIAQHYLFYPAQFWPHKNHVNLLYAVKWLNDHYDLPLPVVFVGSDKGNLDYIQQLAKELNLDRQVHFLGFVSEEELITLYQGALALTFMSFGGPDNLPPLEAFAIGCPVIASNVSGAREQLGDAALIVDHRDQKQIALAIKELYESPTLSQHLVQKGYQRAAQWTSQDYVGEVMKILDEFEPIRRCWR